MSLFTKLFEAVHSWRRRRVGLKARKRADLAMEQLDHRQLLAVNFTGNVPIDFPATQAPGVVVIPSPPDNQVPLIPAPLVGIVSVSGLQINQLRVSYTPADDTLSVGVEGPPNGRDGREVIAGDSDNNGNSATVDPRISNPQGTGAEQGFQDPADMGGTKTYGILLDLNKPNVPDIAAGFPIMSPNPNGVKPFEVARAINNQPNHPDRFDANNVFPQYTGNFYLANDPNHPNFELQIAHFSQLYQQTTGKVLTPTTNLSIGAFAASAQSIGISDEFFPPQPITLSNASPIPPPVVVPAVSVAKTTNGQPSTTPPGPIVAVGGLVTFNYEVTNPGNEPLKNVVVIDNNGTPSNTADDFNPTPVLNGNGLNVGDTNGNGLLDPGEDFRYRAMGTATAGQYENTVSVSATGNTTGIPVNSTSLSHYFGQAPTPPIPVFCPPVSPTVFINPHENNHVNSAHHSPIRVNVLGSSGFNPTTINPATVRLGIPGMSAISGAAPILNFERNVNHDQFPDETFVFDGLSLNLPPGVTNAELSGQTTSGTMFASSVTVFNRDSSYYTPAQINKQQADYARYDQKNNISVTSGNFVAPSPTVPKAAMQRAASMAINDLYDPFRGQTVPRPVNTGGVGAVQAASTSGGSASAVSIQTRHGNAVKAAKAKAIRVHMNAGSRATSRVPSIQQMIAGGA